MLYITLFSLCAGTLASVIQTNKPQFALEDADKYFEDFIKKFDRHYADEDEKKMRLEIFKQNLVKINERNMDPEEQAEFGINNFADKTSDEIIKYTVFISPTDKCKNSLIAESNYDHTDDDIHKCQIQNNVNASTNVPEELDWRQKNVVTSVKKQGNCGSCWAFGTVGNVESMYAIKYNKLIDFSEQQLVDCDLNDNGCNGGLFHLSFGSLVTTGGVMTLKDYPYTAEEGICQLNKTKIVAKVKDCILFDSTDEEQLRNHVATYGPVALAIDARTFMHYSGGIMTNCPYKQLTHAVLLVGYGTENGTQYWIIKNSYGAEFGEKGYVRVKRNINACGLLNACSATAIVA